MSDSGAVSLQPGSRLRRWGRKMADGNSLRVSDQRAVDLPMRRFALRIVTELVRTGGRGRRVDPAPALAALVIRFARTGESDLLRLIHQEMVRHKIPAEDIMDVYMPQAVVDIGEDWHADRLDILQATMGFARLQNLLRELSRAWLSDLTGRPTDGRILLMMPRGEQHSLGAMFAANQLRRMGVSVKVLLAANARDLAQTMERSRFHGVFLSVSNISAVDDCADLISELRCCDPAGTPVVLGGGLVSIAIDANDTSRIAARTGADLVTSDIARAIHFCGIQQVSAAAE